MKLCYNHLMEYFAQITPPRDEHDAEAARSAFEEFVTIYEPTLVSIEYYLEQVIEEVGSGFAEAYKPWQQGLHDLLRGAYLMSKKIPLPDTESFVQSLHMFSFDSAIQFLCDLCESCRIVLERDWAKRFKEHISRLLFCLSIATRQEQLASLTH